jgi:hypothetical protein
MRVRDRAARLVLSPPVVIALAGFGALFGALSGMALSWDGSYYLFNTLESQRPFEPHLRYVNAITQAPTLLAERFTDQLPILRLAYGLAYMAVPVLALLACWVVLRRGHRHMFIWPVLAILVATLPGQVNATCEALQSAQLIWPALLAGIVGIERGDRLTCIVVLATGLFAAVAHPFGVVLVGGVLLVCLLRRRRTEAIVAGGLLVVAVANAVLSFDPYETDQITTAVITNGFHSALWGGPMTAIGTSAVGAALIAFADRSSRRTLLAALGVACQVLAIAALVRWANDPRQWSGAIDFRTFTPTVTVPVALVALYDGGRPGSQDGRWRQLAAVAAAAGFAAIMVVQGLSVQRLDNTLTTAMKFAGGCVAQQSIPGIRGTMLDHWATPSRSLLFGSRAATSIMLPDDQCSTLTDTGSIPLADWDVRTVYSPGWFDLRDLRRNP